MQLRFADCEIDCDQYVFTRAGRRVDLQPKVWAFLRLLAENGDRVVPKDEILDALWPDVVVSEGSLQRLASLAREALGKGDLLRTIRGVGYQLAAEVEVIDRTREQAGSPEAADGADGAEANDRPPAVRFCRTSDGANIAWSSTGEGSTVVRALGWFTNLEFEYTWTSTRRFWESLGRGRRLIRYDGRGMGLSDPSSEFTAERRLRDLEAVVDASQADRVDLIGFSEGCGSAIRYALRHPERVGKLVLYGPPALLFREKHEDDVALGRVMLSLIQAAWGSGSGAFGRLLAEMFVGQSASTETRELFDRMQRASTNKDTAIRYLRSMAEGGLAEIESLRVETLMIHRRNDLIALFEGARTAARKIPGARFVTLEGDNHWPMDDDPRAHELLQTIVGFLDEA